MTTTLRIDERLKKECEVVFEVTPAAFCDVLVMLRNDAHNFPLPLSL